MTDVDLINVLTRFHREIVMPDIERTVDERLGRVDGRIDNLHNEMMTNFDYVFQRLSILSDEYHLLNAAVRRLEEAR